jgi:hypothetical protein
VKPTPTEQMANIYAAFEETEEYYEMAGEVVRLAREWLISKKSLSAGYRDGHGVLSEVSQRRRANMHKTEDALDAAIESLEAWLKQRGFDAATRAAVADEREGEK